MNRGGDYALGKRQKEAQRARKQQEKAARRAAKREKGPGGAEIVSASDVVGELPTVDEAMQALEDRAAAPRSVAPIPARLFVGGLGQTTNEEMLREAFGEYGRVIEVAIVHDRNTGLPRGFGFVTMEDRKNAGRAIDALNGFELNGRRLMVDVATERQR
jgi:hypothetical protein